MQILSKVGECMILAKCDSALNPSCQEEGFFFFGPHVMATLLQLTHLAENIHSSKHLLGPKAHPLDQK
jgi:hypothetical protein